MIRAFEVKQLKIGISGQNPFPGMLKNITFLTSYSNVKDGGLEMHIIKFSIGNYKEMWMLFC